MALDFLQQLRLRDLFSGPMFGGQVNNPSLFRAPTVNPTIPSNAPDTELTALRRYPTPFMDQYRDVLTNAPRREDYKTGKIGKILALTAGGLTGATEGISRGIATGTDILDRPYNRALEDYGMKAGRFRELADIENKNLTNQQRMELEGRKVAVDEFKALTEAGYRDAQAKKLLNDIKTSGKRLEKNTEDGQLYVVDINTNTKVPLGKFAESAGEKRQNDFTFFKKEEGVRQAGRKELEGIRFGNDKALAKLKQELADKSVSATQDNAAWEGAYNEILTEYPEMKARLFETDDKGNLVLRKDKQGNPLNPDAYDMFVNAVRERKGTKLGKPSTGFTGEVPPPPFIGPKLTPGVSPNTNAPTVATASENIPQVNNPTQTALRQTAIQAIKETYPNNPELLTNEAAIQEAMRQLSENVPSVSPTNNEGMFSRFGTATPAQPYVVSDPNPFRKFYNSIPPLTPESRQRAGY